jgi:hypothetical protein
VHDNAASKIDNALFGKKTSAPYPASHGDVHQQRPQRAKCHYPTKARALDPCTHNQRWGDDRKGHLEQGKGKFANRLVFTNRIQQAAKHEIFCRADIAVAVHWERKAVTDGNPDKRCDRRNRATLDQNRQEIFGADQSAIEKRKAG